MRSENISLSNWGNYPAIEAELLTPASAEEARAAVRAPGTLIARGNGRCYGDAALAPRTLSTLALNRILAFDGDTGTVHCESGVLLADILALALPAGWFFHVTPGIKNITVGGAIACDVHGKNHPDKGCFSNWLLSFDLLLGDGAVIRCSRTEHPDVFWQTCGGMGWTGVILSARFQLMRLPGDQMRQTAEQAANLEALFRAFEDRQDMPYAAGWVDCLASGKAFGRGVVYFAEHATSNSHPETWTLGAKKAKNVPFFAPSWLLNPLSIRAHNAILFSKAQSGEQLVSLERYFYPLDSVQNWNRLYGSRGFIQYQFCLPEAGSFDGIRHILQTIGESRDTPFLTVLKRHGERPPEAVHSFPVKGYSLALDFPRTKSIFALVNRLDTLVWQYGGRIYLAKDACSAGKMGRVDPRAFGDPKFTSTQKVRILSSL